MKKQYLVIALMLVAFALVVITQNNSDSIQSTPTGVQVYTAQTQTASPEDLSELRAQMVKFRTAAHAGDVETIVSLHSDKFVSEDATGKDEVREFWTMIVDFGFASKLELDLETMVTRVDGIGGGVHVLYKGMHTDVDTTQIAWDFLKRFSKSNAIPLPGK